MDTMRVSLSLRQKSPHRSKLVPNEWLRLVLLLCKLFLKYPVWCMWKVEPNRRTMGDNDLPHRTSIALEVSRETRKFVNCCSGSSLLHDFLIVSINELEFNGREKRRKKSTKTIKKLIFLSLKLVFYHGGLSGIDVHSIERQLIAWWHATICASLICLKSFRVTDSND